MCPFNCPNLKETILCLLASIELRLDRQINAILHHPHFQTMEIHWRGLHQISQMIPKGALVELHLFNCQWQELQTHCIEARQHNILWRRLDHERFDLPGAKPCSVLISHDSFEDLQPVAKNILNNLLERIALPLICAGKSTTQTSQTAQAIFTYNTPTLIRASIDLQQTLALPWQFNEDTTAHYAALTTHHGITALMHATKNFQKAHWFGDQNLLFQHLCVCRMIHYLKMILRTKIGGFHNPLDVASTLQRWLLQYCADRQDLSLKQRYKYPWRRGHVAYLPHSKNTNPCYLVTLTPHVHPKQPATHAFELRSHHVG